MTIMRFTPFITTPFSTRQAAGFDINVFQVAGGNIDELTVVAFGEEWSKFSSFEEAEINQIASSHYFDIVPESAIRGRAILDVGCGTGRWTKYACRTAATVDAVDPSKAIDVAARLLEGCDNVRLSQASVDHLPFEDNSFDFVFSLGVLHHIPDTQSAMQKCVDKLKPGGYFLVYLYYAFDSRGVLFKTVFHLSALLRKMISRLPGKTKDAVCDVAAVVIYLPFVGLSSLFKKVGMEKVAKKMPLHFYVGKSFNIIRNDARDRFGTPLEQRFTKSEIRQMMEKSGLTEIIFSDNESYWHAVGKKK